MRPITAALVALVLLAAPLRAEDGPVNPTKAYNALMKEMRRVPAAEKPAAMKKAAEEYLASWEASGQTAEGKHLYSLAQFHQAAEQYEKAMAAFRQVQEDEKAEPKHRDLSAVAEANLLLQDDVRGALGQEGIDKAGERLAAYAGTMDGPARLKHRSTLRYLLANLHEAADRKDAAHDLRMQIVADDPGFLSKVYGSIMRGLLGSTHAMEGYDPLRKKASATIKALSDTQATIVAEKEAKHDKAVAKLRKSNPDALDEEGNLTVSDHRKMGADERAVYSAARALRGAQALLERIGQYATPFGMLGKPAPEWTLEKAYGDVTKLADLKGKVVVLDFWATWCPWCIRSFPALRDLVEAYEGKDLALVGVTATGSVVYESRYDLDEDLAEKHDGGRPVYAARRASERAPADPAKSILEDEAYRARELEAIAAFMANHQMTWPVVMIDEDEPAEKYALAGWPHAVVLDREGRIRYFKSGALLRGDADAVAAFHKVLDDILAEPAGK